jgi:formylglycine-generating enzyme required for sulfatase activity
MGNLRINLFFWIGISFLQHASTAFAQPFDLRLDGRPDRIALSSDTVKLADNRIGLLLQVDSDLDSLAFDVTPAVLAQSAKTGSWYLWLDPSVTTLAVRRNGFMPFTLNFEERGIAYDKSPGWKVRITSEKVLSVNFVVKPEDATLFINGKKVSAPRVQKLRFGRHQVVVEKPGFKKEEKTIVVDEGTTLFQFTLKQVELQAVSIRTEPQGARLFLDDIEKGLTDKGLFLYPGKYRIKLVLSGYLDAEEEVTVTEGGPAEFSVALRKNAGTFTWQIDPPTARVMVNREDVTSKASVDLAPGKYQLDVVHPGFDVFQETIEIKLGKTFHKTLSLKRQAGHLQLNVTPLETDYELVMDGLLVKRGSGTAMWRDLPAGNYYVHAWSEGMSNEIKTFSVARDATTLLDVRLKKASAPIAVTPAWTSPKLDAKFVWIEPGQFPMGSHPGPADETPVHTVHITRGFYLAVTEVTQKQWKTIMGANPSPTDGDELPVSYISWNEAQEFIKKLNEAEPGQGYRLPTEAEWEYACSAGAANDASLGTVAWFQGNSGSKVQPVAGKNANRFGLHDMLGNVWEWTSDWYSESYYANTPSRDPRGPASGLGKVLRGGSYQNPAANVRPGYRLSNNPDYRSFNYGLRLVRDAVK